MFRENKKKNSCRRGFRVMCKILNEVFFYSIFRIVLLLLSIIFFFIGLIVFIIGSILTWSSATAINKILKNDEITSIITDLDSLNVVSVGMLILGAFIIILSIFSIIGFCYVSRCLVKVYELTLIILFFLHVSFLIYSAIKSPHIEREFRKSLNDTMANLNNPNEDPKLAEEYCDLFRVFSDIFDCCGANGPSDFSNQTLTKLCCLSDVGEAFYLDEFNQNQNAFSNSTLPGCSDKVVSAIKDNSLDIILIPNSIILVFELIIILMVAVLIGGIRRDQNKRSREEEGIINLRPATYGMDLPTTVTSSSRDYRY